MIERAALDGAETVRRLLGFARSRDGDTYAPVDLSALLAQVLEVTRPRWRDESQARGAPIQADLALEPVPPVWGNAAELREVVVNLVFNAVDAMSGGGRLTLGVRPLPPAGVELFVRDTGVGMPETIRRRAFDPFFTTKGVKGTGLGLSIVYGIVTRHGGDVEVQSQEGLGTTVRLTLPVGAGEAPAPDPPVVPPPARPGRILVVDDESALADLLADFLRLQGHDVAVFSDPRRALAHLERAPVDLVFSDLGMPDLSGWDVAARAREHHPTVPVIMVTGWGDQLDRARAEAAGIAAVVAKPYHLEEIVRLVGTLLPAGGPPPA
jgi:CheY-like chemotaxis protein